MSSSHSPSEELRHFTDRDLEQKRFRDVLSGALALPLPTLNFYGVGGVGKTWLRRRFQEIRRKEFPALKSAFIDFDTRFRAGAKYAIDPSDAWFEIAKSLEIPCPRFLLAYAVMLAKQTSAPLEAKKLSGGEASKLEVAGQLATQLLGTEWVKAAFDGIPLVGLIPFLARKGTERVAEVRLERNPDFQELQAQEPDEIYKKLLARLIDDLNAYAPKGAMSQCHSVVLLDTFEMLGDATNKIAQSTSEAWVRQFARGTKRTAVVILGRNRLWWDEKLTETYWNQTRNLEQHLVGSLSESDARLYLTRCEISDEALQDEVLKDSSCAPQPGYHPWTLGLCGDTLWSMREERGDNSFPPAREFLFEAGEHGPTAVVNRFLETQSDARRLWIERLAVTLRFDEAAALNACRAGEDEREAAWERLREFSFLSASTEDGWFTLHHHMRNQILAILPAKRKSTEHEFWRTYWLSRVERRTQ